VDEERNLLVRVAAACRLMISDIERLPEPIASDEFVEELRRVCGRAAERLETLAEQG
jgi:hypothetical protein